MLYSRILAIDVRSQSFGFAALEEPNMLLDYGRKSYLARDARDVTEIVHKKIGALLDFFTPSTIVLKGQCNRNGQHHLNRQKVFKVITREASVRSVEVIRLQRADIDRAFRQSGNFSKYKIAGLIVQRFPELAWKLPAKRKNWQPEHYNMTIFDAASLALAYLARAENLSPAERRESPS